MTRRARGLTGLRYGLLIGTLVGTLVGLAGCHADPSTSRGRAELFLDAYYVEIDLPRALEHTAGVAHAKVEQSIELTRNNAIDETTERPTVHYRFDAEHPDGAAAVNYVYLADLTAAGESSQRKIVLTVRQQDGDWRVTNFQEFTP